MLYNDIIAYQIYEWGDLSMSLSDKELAYKAFLNREYSFRHSPYEKEFEFSKIKVNSISNDPKLFELEVTDGNITLYARSIWAAEWSDKMIPHFRFIITNKRQR